MSPQLLVSPTSGDPNNGHVMRSGATRQVREVGWGTIESCLQQEQQCVYCMHDSAVRGIALSWWQAGIIIIVPQSRMQGGACKTKLFQVTS